MPTGPYPPVQITDINSRQGNIRPDLIQIFRIQNHENTSDRLAPQRADKIRADRTQKRHGIFSAVIQSIKVDRSLFRQRRRCLINLSMN